MKAIINEINLFLEQHNKLINNFASALGLGSLIFSIVAWLSDKTAWLWPAIAGIALFSLLLANIRVHYCTKSIAQLNQALNLLNDTYVRLMADWGQSVTQNLKQGDQFSITAMAASYETMRQIKEQLGKSTTEIDQALLHLAEYERQTRKN